MALLSLEKSILATLVYYDVLDQPLVNWEIFKYLINYLVAKPLSMLEVLDILENSSELNKYISQKNGFYFLKNREEIIELRIKRQIISDRKWKKARRIIRFLQIIPYIRMVAVSGSLAMNNTKEESDIDLLIITKSGRIWTCRALVTLYFHIIGQRRHGKLTKNRFCLNHYITDKSLKIPHKSLYNAQTYAHLVPIWQKEGLYNKFQKYNSWIKEYLVNYPIEKKGYLDTKSKKYVLDIQFGDKLEYFLRNLQEKKIKKEPLTYKAGGRVVFNDNQLEFHPNSPEKNILRKYNQKMKELGFEELANEKDSGLTL